MNESKSKLETINKKNLQKSPNAQRLRDHIGVVGRILRKKQRAKQSVSELTKVKKNFECTWENNLLLDAGNPKSAQRLGVASDLFTPASLTLRKALSLPAPLCGKGKKICYGQTACVGVYKNYKAKNSTTFKQLKYDLYTYASCVVDTGKPCLNATNCIKQDGAIDDLVKTAKGVGYFENSSGKYEFKSIKKGQGVQ